MTIQQIFRCGSAGYPGIGNIEKQNIEMEV